MYKPKNILLTQEGPGDGGWICIYNLININLI